MPSWLSVNQTNQQFQLEGVVNPHQNVRMSKRPVAFGGEIESAVDLVGRIPLGKVGSWTGWTGDRLPKTREL